MSCLPYPQHLTQSLLPPFWNSFSTWLPETHPYLFSLLLHRFSFSGSSADASPTLLISNFGCVQYVVLRSLPTIFLVSSFSPMGLSDPYGEGFLVFCPDWDFLTHITTIHRVHLSNSGTFGLPPSPNLLHPSSFSGQKLGVIHRYSLFFYILSNLSENPLNSALAEFKAEYLHSNYFIIYNTDLVCDSLISRLLQWSSNWLLFFNTYF